MRGGCIRRLLFYALISDSPCYLPCNKTTCKMPPMCVHYYVNSFMYETSNLWKYEQMGHEAATSMIAFFFANYQDKILFFEIYVG